MTYFPVSTDKWSSQGGAIVFEVNEIDTQQCMKVVRTFKVYVSPEYIEDTYNVSDGSDLLGIARENHEELEDIAMQRIASGGYDADGNIMIMRRRL